MTSATARSPNTPGQAGLRRFYLEDTISVTLDGRETVGVVTRTWHDLNDDEVVWEEIDEAVPGAVATKEDLSTFQRTGNPPRHFLLFSPSSPFHPPSLVHESECKLLDRAFMFGDYVKRSSDTAKSGVVISVDSAVALRPTYFDANHPELWPPSVETRGVPGSELELYNHWGVEDLVIYKNSWVGVVKDVIEEVVIKLQDDSVVMVDDPELLVNHTPVQLGQEGQDSTIADAQGRRTNSGRRSSTTRRMNDVDEPAAVLCVGQPVNTTKANLRRGKWILGAYNADIPAEGVIVAVKPMVIYVDWIVQNMMVPGRFVPIPPPPRGIDLQAEEHNITKFTRATGGLKAVNGEAYTNLLTSGGATLQIGDRVLFSDIDAAEQKYQGTIKKIPKRAVQGFETNIFVVCETKACVRVQWQDNSETVEDSCALIPYLNVDEHEVWPGEMVLIKGDTTGATEKFDSQLNPSFAPTSTESTPNAPQFQSLFLDALAHPEGGNLDYMRPSRVGVVQSADADARVAKVRWFKDPHVEIVSLYTLPGSRTGGLDEKVEDMSFYEIFAHQAIGLGRGDLVIIAPPIPEQSRITSNLQSSYPAQQLGLPGMHELENQNTALLNQILGSDDSRSMHLFNLSTALNNHSHPQLQTVARMLDQIPGLAEAVRNQNQSPIAPEPGEVVENTYLGTPLDWIGEVVDLGLDGLVTVRLGALSEPRDIRLPIERLIVVYTDDMDMSEGDVSDDEDDMSDLDEPRPIMEVITYEGGERLDNGDEGDWDTEESDDSDDEDDSDIEMPDAPVFNSDSPSTAQEPVPRTPPPIPDNVPAPEAITLPSNQTSPPRFMVLDSPVPADHKFLGQASGPPSTGAMKIIMREHKILAQSLPEGIFVRTWESHLDLLRVLIIGPLNTPYERAPFVFDFCIPPTYPQEPPKAFFHSWTNGMGRVNPNLYEDGKICLSLLGTWHADTSSETWIPNQSTMLQVFVSIMALVLVREPWYNEAGFTIYEGAKDVSLNSQQYSEKAYILSREFVRHALVYPVHGLEDVVGWLYITPSPDGPNLLRLVVEKTQEVMDRSEAPGAERLTIDDTPEAVGRLSKGAMVLLKRTMVALKGMLDGQRRAPQ
ncbi:hypothetical protein EX30DRAFT_330800 [Ascodesmis nigricans]|uniref:UBC core domain-containing protein n=1 Tax=Ascodesmis nigricans TaxID=341454 RepID=A0A4S2MY59_9PEZI|nr:hypothetical protein EX30DRAFT_330800 [Ascodesmis nigricans]